MRFAMLILVFFSFRCLGQESGEFVHPDYDWSASIFLGGPFDKFDLSPRVGASLPQLNYRPSSVLEFGASLSYKWLGGAVAFNLPTSDTTVSTEGIVSKFRDYRVGYYWHSMGVELSYSSFQGYLIDNSEENLSASTLKGNQYYSNASIKNEGFGANFMYVLSPERYSFPAAEDQSERQLKSAGSWLLIGTARVQNYLSSGPLLPAELQSLFGEDALLDKAHLVTIAAGGGYGYTYVHESFYIAGILAASLGWQWTGFHAGVDSSTSSPAFNGHSRLSLGYNSDRYFFGISAFADVDEHQTTSIEIADTSGGATIFAGSRW